MTNPMTLAQAATLVRTMNFIRDSEAPWYDDAAAEKTIVAATRKGWVRRPSTTQVEWTKEGIAAYEVAMNEADKNYVAPRR